MTAWSMVGRRVQIPAHFDAWMRGDRFGTIVRQNSAFFRIRMERSGKMYSIRIDDLENFGEYL